MQMAVEEAGQQSPPAQVDAARFGVGQIQRVVIAANGQNAPVRTDGNGLRPRGVPPA